MENPYAKLLSETYEKIKDIRCSSLKQITEVQSLALAQVEQDFITLDWNKYWTSEQLFSNGQFERFEQSVIDTDLKIVDINDNNKSGVIEDRVALCKVSGSECNCADFVFRGLPCRHMYYLASALINLIKPQTETETS